MGIGTVALVLLQIAQAGIGFARDLVEATFQILEYGETLVLVFFAISLVGDVTFSGTNLFLAVGKNIWAMYVGLSTPINVSALPPPLNTVFAENPLFGLIIRFVDVYKLGVLIDIVFHKLGGLAISWYSFVWSFISKK